MIPAAGQHGGDGARLAAALGVAPSEILDLSASLNPLAPDIAPIVNRHLESIGRYPDPEPARTALAEAIGVPSNELLLTNGGSEAIALCCDELVGRYGSASLRQHDFSLYARHLSIVSDHGPRVCSNPGNPTGQLLDVTSGLDEDGTPVGIWDEAFWPLATGTWTSGAHCNGQIVVGSLTKLFACPGLRLGYVLADPDTIAVLEKRQPQWSVGTLAADVVPDLLKRADLPGWASGITQRRNILATVLHSYGYNTIPGVNWLLATRAGQTGSDIRSALAKHLVLVRDCTSFGLPQYVRIAIPSDNSFTKLERSLELSNSEVDR